MFVYLFYIPGYKTKKKKNIKEKKDDVKNKAHPPHSHSSPPRPNRPPNPPRSLRKNFPIFFRLSFKGPEEPPPSAEEPCAWPAGAGVDDDEGGPEAAAEAEEMGFPRASPRGVPKRSTPSFAAEMMAEPRVEGSKRVGRLEAPMEAAAAVLRLRPPWEVEEVAEEEPAEEVCRMERMGLLEVRLGAWRSEALWIWKSSTRWFCSWRLRMPLMSRILRKLALLRSAMWIR